MPNRIKWFKTDIKGLRYRIHPTRKRKKGLKTEYDTYYQYRHEVDGKRIEEGFGWLFDGMAFEKAVSRVYELKENKRHGTGPDSLRAKRAEQKKKKLEQKKAEAKERKQKVTFSELWTKYLPYSQATKKNRRGWMREVSLYNLYIQPNIGDKPMTKISPFHLEKMKKSMLDRKRAPRTISYALAVTRQVFNYAIRNDLYTGGNPVSKVNKPTADNKRSRFFSQKDANLLLSELKKKDQDVYAMALLSFRCGLRAAEILHLSWGVVDFENEQVHIMDTKSGRNRFVFMTEDIKALLISRLLMTKDNGPNELIFKRGDDPYLEIPKVFKRVVDNLGFNSGITDRRQKLVFHSCRHSFASWHAAAGTDLHILQKLLGHETFAMVLRYAHLKPDTLKAAIKQLEAKMSDTGSEVIPLKKSK
jgi:integrase